MRAHAVLALGRRLQLGKNQHNKLGLEYKLPRGRVKRLLKKSVMAQDMLPDVEGQGRNVCPKP